MYYIYLSIYLSRGLAEVRPVFHSDCTAETLSAWCPVSSHIDRRRDAVSGDSGGSSHSQTLPHQPIFSNASLLLSPHPSRLGRFPVLYRCLPAYGCLQVGGWPAMPSTPTSTDHPPPLVPERKKAHHRKTRLGCATCKYVCEGLPVTFAPCTCYASWPITANSVLDVTD